MLTLHSCRLLIVENDLDSRSLLTFIFEQAGATVVTVPSAYQALEVLTGFKPDMLISDLVLPGIDGYALLHTVRQNRRWRYFPAIAVTALVGEQFQRRALAAGYQAYLVKPVDPDSLITTVNALLDYCCLAT